MTRRPVFRRNLAEQALVTTAAFQAWRKQGQIRLPSFAPS
jgi:hypothetical protein